MRFKILLYLGCVSLLATATAQAQEPLFEFGVIADAQYADQPPHNNRYYRKSPARLQEAVDTLNQLSPAFTVQLGDMIDRDVESFDDLLPIWDQLNMDAYHVLGNHDYDVALADKPLIPQILGMGENYYSFKVKNWRFLVIDGNEVSLYAHAPGTKPFKLAQKMIKKYRKQGRVQANVYNGAVGKDQFKWIKKELKEACKADEKVIIFSHFPVHPPHETNLWNAEELKEVIENNSCTKAVLSGHFHEGNYAVDKGVHYLTMKGMVQEKEKNAFALFKIFEGYIEVVGYGREPNRRLDIF